MLQLLLPVVGHMAVASETSLPAGCSYLQTTARDDCGNFYPELHYTDEGYYEGGSPTVKWEGASSWQTPAGEMARVEIRDIHPEGHSQKSVGVLVWIRSQDHSVVFAPLAVPDNRTTTTDLATEFRVDDPGLYEVHIAVHTKVKKGDGAHDTLAQIVPLRGSPWYLRVTAEDGTAPLTTQIKLPSRRCRANDMGVGYSGRWVQCKHAGIPADNCLRDGWVFMPHNCRHEMQSINQIRSEADALKRARGNKPLWVVVTGSSIARGTLHALVDVFGGVPLPEDPTRTISEVLMNGVQEERGKGNMLKCWGFYDVEIGGLRLTFQDFRTAYMPTGEQFAEACVLRAIQLVSEGPDMLVLGDVLIRNHIVRMGFRAVFENPNFDGIVAIGLEPQRFLSGGPKIVTWKEGQNAQTLIKTYAAELGQNLKGCTSLPGCDTVRDKFTSATDPSLVLVDDTAMSWPFIFDMERNMSSNQASQHFHYSVKVDNRDAAKVLHQEPRCGSKVMPTRFIYGAVPEMSGRIFLTQALHRAKAKAGLNSVAEIDPCHDVSFRGCFTCPEKACCPWLPPQQYPSHTLSTSTLAGQVPSFKNLSMQSCYVSRP